jgi:diguanylate cyclase (GGDEF)-like protein
MHGLGRRLLLPASIVAAAALLHGSGWIDRLGVGELRIAVRGAFLLAFALAWRFRCSRAGWGALWLALAVEVPGYAADPAAAEAALALLVPPGLAILAWLPERPLACRAGIVGAAAVAAVAAVVAWLDPTARWLPPTIGSELAAPPGANPGLSSAALAGLGLALAVAALRLVRSADPISLGLLAAVATAGLALAEPDGRLVFLGAGGLALGAALVDRAFRMTLEDALTELPSRRALDARLRLLNGSFAIAMVDLDRFKALNDRHGHAVGDQALRWVARRLAAVGGGGEAFRYGGEEFAIVFPGATVAEARPHAEEVRKTISEDRFVLRGPGRPARRPKRANGGSATTRGSGTARVTVSVGLAATTSRRRLPREVLAAADRALYRAKKAGRNRVVAAR